MAQPRLLCLPADTPESLARLGVASFIWRHYAPAAYFSRIVYAFLGEQKKHQSIDGRSRIHVFRRRWGKALPLRIFFYAVRVPYFAACLVRIIRRERIDVVRARSASFNALAGVIAAKLTGIRCAISIHAPYAEDRKLSERAWLLRMEEALIERLSIRFADRIYCVGNAMRPYAISMGARPERVQVLFNRVNTARFASPDPGERDRLRTRYSICAAARVLVTVGRLVPQKDPMTLLEAFRQLREKDPDYHLLVIGVGYMREEMDQYIDRNGLADAVSFTGNVRNEELPHFLHLADAFLLPTRYEGFGIVLIEAQAAGTAIVTSRIDDTADIVNDENAWLVPVEDPDALAAAVCRVFDERHTTLRRIEAGLRSVRRFDESVIESREMALYDELLQRAPASGAA